MNSPAGMEAMASKGMKTKVKTALLPMPMPILIPIGAIHEDAAGSAVADDGVAIVAMMEKLWKVVE